MTVAAGVGRDQGHLRRHLRALRPATSRRRWSCTRRAPVPRARSAPRCGQLRRRRRRHHALHYEADAVVGGMIGGVGQRMLTSVSKRMASEFFGNVDTALSGVPNPPVRRAASGRARRDHDGSGAKVFTAPARPPARRQQTFLKGVAVGARLVLLGRARRRGSTARRWLDTDRARHDVPRRARWRTPSATGSISARELLELHLARIAERNPELNAIVSLDDERAREGAGGRRRGHQCPAAERWAAARAAVRVQGHARRGRLADDVRLAAVRRPRAPTRDDLVVERIRAAGAVRRSARPTCRSSRPARTRSTRSSAPPATRST